MAQPIVHCFRRAAVQTPQFGARQDAGIHFAFPDGYEELANIHVGKFGMLRTLTVARPCSGLGQRKLGRNQPADFCCDDGLPFLRNAARLADFEYTVLKRHAPCSADGRRFFQMG